MLLFRIRVLWSKVPYRFTLVGKHKSEGRRYVSIRWSVGTRHGWLIQDVMVFARVIRVLQSQHDPFSQCEDVHRELDRPDLCHSRAVNPFSLLSPF